MRYYRVGTGHDCIIYHQALETALRYGWIDSILKKVDDESYVRKFTPRRPKSQWSPINLSIARNLISEGRMSEMGMMALGDALEKQNIVPENDGQQDEMDELFKDDPVTRKAFEALSPSYRKQYSRYILSAKEQGTRERRTRKSVVMIREGRPPLL
jgi:uncharacterized protein YdeI (YjbR/CyaY-like superfamily)